MCTSIVEIADAEGAGKGSDGWFDLTHSVVSYDHPHHALLEEAINIDFVKLGSYSGIDSSGKMTEHFSWQSSLKNRHVIIVEDIVDTGHTLSFLKNKINDQNPASLEVACLLFKPQAYQYQDAIHYKGKDIPNDFVVGYGLDYEGLGRNLDCIYRKK